MVSNIRPSENAQNEHLHCFFHFFHSPLRDPDILHMEGRPHQRHREQFIMEIGHCQEKKSVHIISRNNDDDI